MDQSRVLELIDELSDQIDTLESSLEPFTGDGALNKHAESLPLLDRAKLYTTTAYAIESLLYNHLSLAGEDAKNHPVMTELSRVKQYFEKIRDAEDPSRNKRPEGVSLDKNAAKRFIKHALSGNEQYDVERANKKTKFLYPDDERTIATRGNLKMGGKYFMSSSPFALNEESVGGAESEAHPPPSISEDNTEMKQTKRQEKSNPPLKSSTEAMDALLAGSVQLASNPQADELREQKEERKRQKRREKKERKRQRKNEMKENATELKDNEDGIGT